MVAAHLPRAAAHVAHVATPLALATKNQARMEREDEVKVDELALEFRATGNGARRL